MTSVECEIMSAWLVSIAFRAVQTFSKTSQICHQKAPCPPTRLIESRNHSNASHKQTRRKEISLRGKERTFCLAAGRTDASDCKVTDALYAWCANAPLKKAARFLGLK